MQQPIKDRLGQLQSQLPELDSAVRWVNPRQVHLTLQFLGEVPDETVRRASDAVAAAAAQVEPFDIEVTGTGCFPPGGSARIVWVGVREPTGRLVQCQQRCEQTLSRLGFKREARRFTPHLTIARVKDFRASKGIRAAVERAVFTGGSQSVDEIVLFQSHLAPSGATYTVVSRARLGGASSDSG